MENVVVKNENTLKQLESFDFKAPVKVTVILDESDDEDTPITNIKKEYTNEESSTRIGNVEENGCVSNIDILVTNNKVKKENKTPYDNNADLTEYLHFKTPEHAPNNSTSDCSNLKKCDELTSVNDNNDPKIRSSDKNNKISNDKINNKYIVTSKAPEQSSVNLNDNNKTDQKNDHGETNHLKSLLETIADNLLIIIDAYNYHIRLRSDDKTERYTLDASLANFFRIKLHFFNLSFCTVLVLIIPQENNDSFHEKFLLDVIKRAQSKKGINIPYQLIRDLYFELITWSKTKPEYINNLTTKLQAKNNVQIQNDNNNSLLKYQLNNPPYPLTNTAEVYQNNNHFTGGVLTHSNTNYPPVMHTATPSYEAPTKFPPQYDSFTPYYYNQAQSDADKTTFNHTNPPTNGTGNSMPNSTMYKELSKILNTNSTVNSNNNTRKRSSTSGKTKRPSKSSKTNHDPQQTCIFTAGPPGRQISMNVEQSELNSNQISTNFNFAYSNFIAARELQNVKPPPPQAQYGSHDVGPHVYQRTQNSSKQMQIPQNQHSYDYHQSRVNTIPPPNYTVPPPPPYQRHWQNEMPTLAQQNLSPKQPQPQFQNEQAYVQNVQNLSAKQPQPQFQNEQAYVQNLSAKQPQPQFQNEQAYVQNIQNLSAKQPQPQFQYEQAYVQNIQNLSAKQPQPQFQHEQAYVQNVLESTRSVSTDSGFTSPLNFNNSTEEMGNTNKEEEAQSNILITHVTSLNPNASFIKEDKCHVCGKGTSKMCLGCFKTYYCSAECQKSDWSLHRHLCKKT